MIEVRLYQADSTDSIFLQMGRTDGSSFDDTVYDVGTGLADPLRPEGFADDAEAWADADFAPAQDVPGVRELESADGLTLVATWNERDGDQLQVSTRDLRDAHAVYLGR